MTLLKKLGLATSILAFSGVASAATYNLGEDPYKPDAAGTFNSTFVVADAGIFTDYFNFTTDYSGREVVNFTTDTGTSVDFSTLGLYSGYDASGSLLGEWSGVNAGNISFVLKDSLGLVSGTKYSFKLIGDADIANSSYNVSISPISAVPEPAALAMMLGGLGLVGFMANRRRKAA